MQRSFRNAGAENLVIQVYQKIKTISRTNFMSGNFYQNIAIQKNIHDSFYLSQKKLKERYPGNPEIYSAFILIE